MASRKKNAMKEVVRETMQELKNGNDFEADPRLDTDEAEQIGAGGRFVKGQQKKDEIIIDALLQGIRGKQGYFLKIKKELTPGNWMLMKTIEEDWRQWADIEVKVSEIVKDHTKRSPQKWGTGPYRVEIGCHGGMRGEPFPLMDFSINADEEFMNLTGNGGGGVSTYPGSNGVNGEQGIDTQLDRFSGFMTAVKSLLPPPPDPSKQQDLMSQSFIKGMELSKGDGNQSQNMMLGFMTMMMGVIEKITNSNRAPVELNPRSLKTEMAETLSILKDMGVVNPPQPVKQEKSTMDFLNELRAFGVEPFKQNDPIEQFGKLKGLISMVTDFASKKVGSPEEKGVFDEIISGIAPHVGKIIEAATSVGQHQIPQQVPVMIQQAPPPQPQGAPMPTQAVPVQPAIDPALQALYEGVITQDYGKFPVFKAMIEGVSGGSSLLGGLKYGAVSEANFYQMVLSWTQGIKDQQFSQGLRDFTDKFVKYIKDGGVSSVGPKEQVPNKPTLVIDGECQTCHAVYTFNNEREFETDAKVCGGRVPTADGTGIMECQGKIVRVHLAQGA